ncbi:MAG: cadmium-translocating P-type ATPase [Lewinellaceae bacterium]|nr:cadmium-translocating P-type ATPase [Phaeodactylibacter sp.]MCB9037382.1 cadmium-translocating P-type ATPase [Lewinellaceae bacterium]
MQNHHHHHKTEKAPEHSHRKHSGNGHHDHHAMMIEDFKKRFWVSLVLTVPVLLLSPMIQQWLGLDWQFAGNKYVLFGLSSIIFFYGGWPFLKGLADELKEKAPGMMTLIAVAIVVAYAYSSAVVFGLEGKTFFWELATLIVVMLLGHWIEMRSVLGASRALEKLIALLPDEAHRMDGDQVQDVKVSELKKGDVILIKPGEKIPADGTITEGESNLNESMLTGESKPVSKEKGDQVIGGAVNGNGSLKVKVEGTGEDSYLSKVVNMVREAQGRKSKTQKLADRAAFWLTIVALTAGFGTLATWLFLGKDFAFALERMVTVMVISCPHALGLAIPLVSAISTAVSAQNGLLIRNRTAFENARKITTLVFDKTGTLTTGEFGVKRFESTQKGLDNQEMLRLAAALEANSEHPIAEGIMAKVKELGLQTPSADNFNAITGKGVEATVEGKQVKVVSPRYLADEGISTPEAAENDGGETIVFVLLDDELAGYIALADQIRPESAEAIQTLHKNGIKTMMLTGDNKAVAASVSRELGLDDFFAEVLPGQKLDKVKALQEKGEYVAMTGDGINDAPALAQADVGIAVGSGTDVAAETADIILVNSNPQDISKLILFGKATYRKMVQNLIWATAYNVVAIPLAAGVLYNWGIMISPAFGAALMSLSTVIVAVNAQLLRRGME